MSEMHLRPPGFTCSACRPFNENKEKIKQIRRFVETGELTYTY